METTTTISQNYLTEMNNISITASQYSGYEQIAASLSKYVSQNIVAGLVGCIIPESGTNHRILNAREYRGGGAAGTEGWNCGEGLIQWTYWKYKLPLIEKYNADSRSTQKLPTSWAEYSKGTPVTEGSQMFAQLDGKHIAGLTLDNQMLFLILYYGDLINQLADETDIAVITAKIYQKKAGTGYYSSVSDPVTRAYLTAKNKYKSSTGNHYLKSLKLAVEYSGSPVTTTVDDTYYADSATDSTGSSSGSYASSSSSSSQANTVIQLASSSAQKENVLKQEGARQSEFASLQSLMTSNTPELGRTIMLAKEMYDPNILKGDQESKVEIFKDTKTENV